MATNMLLSETEVRAGAEYLTSLRALGFDPDVLCWTANIEPGDEKHENHLTIVDSMAERIGPRAIYDLLFRAYDASATPKEIDPFVVALYGPNSAFGDALKAKAWKYSNRTGVSRISSTGEIETASTDDMMNVVMVPGYGVITIYSRPIYVAKQFIHTATQDVERFGIFREHVERLAA